MQMRKQMHKQTIIPAVCLFRKEENPCLKWENKKEESLCLK